MPITIGPKKPMLTAVSDQELEERKARKRKKLKLEAERKAKDEVKPKPHIEKIIERFNGNNKICTSLEKQYNIDDTELKVSGSDLNISDLRGEKLNIDEKKEILEFARMCKNLSSSIYNRAKVVETTKYISEHDEWYKFPLIRAKVEFSRTGTSNITHKGIDPKYYRIVMKILGSETAGTDARVIKTTRF